MTKKHIKKLASEVVHFRNALEVLKTKMVQEGKTYNDDQKRDSMIEYTILEIKHRMATNKLVRAIEEDLR